MPKIRASKPNPRLASRVALITGGGQGIGRALSVHFGNAGFSVAIADKDDEAGQETLAMMAGTARFIPTDVSKESHVQRCIEKILKEFNRLDVLVNNAGVAGDIVKGLDVRAWHRIMATNLTGAFLFSKYALPLLRKESGVIVNVASTRALMSEADTEAYSASKGGLVALTHSLAISLGPSIRVNCISPGWIDTSAWKKNRLRRASGITLKEHKQHPVGRVGTPEDVTALALFLCSPAAGFITGQNYIIDGGMTRKMVYAE